MLKKVTFTGIDEFVSIDELVKLKDKYPFVEFGFLVADGWTGQNKHNRFPSLGMLEKLNGLDLNLALHVCGRLAKSAIQTGTLEDVKEFMGDSFELFQRVQLNVVGVKTFKPYFIDTYEKDVIIQLNYDTAASQKMYLELLGEENIYFLDDKSGGTGKESEPTAFDGYTGFAGGISPENVVNKIKQFEKTDMDDFWIDMESGVRTEDRFNVKKCENICELITKNFDYLLET